jgi:CTP:molybdopterin cytidylyltransferase MocA
MTGGHVAGVVLAAGAGRRMGSPKALIPGGDGRPWVVTAVETLRDAGCARVVVAVGASADEVSHLLDHDVVAVDVKDWRVGMSASLRACLIALADMPDDCALIHLVDLPDVGANVAERLLRHQGSGALARASYDGRPGHPVILGRDHWNGVEASLSGDAGAADYLATNGVRLVECGDLATGRDVDSRHGLSR